MVVFITMKVYCITYCLFFTLFLFVSCRNKSPLFVQLQPQQTGIGFINHVADTDSLNILTYPYLFNGAGVAVADFNHDGKEDIFFVGNKKSSNKLYFNKGNLTFENVTNKAGVEGKSDWCTGASTVDINGDGWMDIYISTVSIPGLLQSANELYINNGISLSPLGEGRGEVTFTEAAHQYGLDFTGHTTQAAFFDYDNDGDLDCFLLNHPIAYADDYRTIAQRKITDSVSGDKLLRNDNNHFVDVTAAANIYSSSIGYGLGIAVGDINNDGWQDIYISNDFKENDYCYINNGSFLSPSGKGWGEVTFTENANELFAHTSRFSMGNDMADYNNDGWLDIMTLDMLSQDERIVKSSVSDDDIETYNYKHHFGFHYQFSKNCLQQNIDGTYFVEKGLQQGVAASDWSWAPLFADFDNDGNKDLYISNGFTYRVNDLDFNAFSQNTLTSNQKKNIATNKFVLVQHIPNGAVADYFYLNKKEDGFADASAEAGFTSPTLSNGAAYADLDNDGDLDLIVNRMNEPAGIYQNNMPHKNYVQIQLNGAGLNTNGIGAKLYVFAPAGMQFLQQSTVRGFMSSVSPLLHVGLDSETQIDSLLIVWSSGKGQWLKKVEINKTIVLDELNATKEFTPYQPKKIIDTTWQNKTALSGIHFIHAEDRFDDLNVQPLLPHSLATQGPALATADVNGDGLPDLFAGGAKDESSALFIQNKDGSFTKSVQQTLLQDSAYEDINAEFFDADGDKDTDLYVTSGGNEFYGRNEWLTDRLYINDGNGNFERSRTLPNLYENKSCVAACDWDKDGDIDLFVGGRANARMYGYTPASVILQNDGKGNFSEVTDAVAKGLQNVGMVTSAVWSDIDKDGWKDLIVAGEWMPVTVFKNNKGKLEKQTKDELSKTNGWWSCMYADDIDGDGDEDFLLGNWGTNSKLKASADFPLRMYLADWDNNGETEPILCVSSNKNYYTFLGKSDLEKRLPSIKKQFLKYGDAAGRTVNEIFGNKAVKQSRRMQAFTLQSSVLWNDKGSLRLEALPSFMQAAPLFSFASYVDKYGKKNYIAGGNFFGVSPYEGRYDAMLPTCFQFQNHKAIKTGCINEQGCVRNIKYITLATGKQILLIAKNNDTLTVLMKK